MHDYAPMRIPGGLHLFFDAFFTLLCFLHDNSTPEILLERFLTLSPFLDPCGMRDILLYCIFRRRIRQHETETIFGTADCLCFAAA